MRYVYVIWCLINGKLYVGQTKHVDRRRRWHFNSKKKASTAALPLYRAIECYGKQHFEFHVIEECTDDVVDERETFWIRDLRTLESEYGYNNESGGNVAKHVSDETQARISQAAKQRFTRMTPEEKEAWKVLLKSRPAATQEQRRKISEHHKGRPKSVAHKTKISESHVGVGCKLPCELFETVVKRYLAGDSVAQMCIDYDVNRTSIYTPLRRVGLIAKVRRRRDSTIGSCPHPSSGQSPDFAAIQ